MEEKSVVRKCKGSPWASLVVVVPLIEEVLEAFHGAQ